MDPFYIIVIVIAVISLILCLVAIGISLQSSTTKVPFPSTQAVCPDGWGTDANFCYMDSVNRGSVVALSNSNSYDASHNVWNIKANTYTGTGFSINPAATICDKQIWAKNTGVFWDGVSNYNQCK
jgi:hypothetical protein